MEENEIAHPPIASQEEWLTKRLALLADEKALTRRYDAVAAERRRLPMVKIEKEYFFDSATGKVSLLDLFKGRCQLIVYHFMFDPEWEKGCPGCTGYVDALADKDISALDKRNTSMVLVSRAPLTKLEAYKMEQGWTMPWVSSFGSDFNYDFHVTLDPAIAPLEYNYLTGDEFKQKFESKSSMTGESPGISVFFRVGDDIYHTYSTYQRGAERVTDAYALLDITPYGRQEDWETSPAGWPQKPTYG